MFSKWSNKWHNNGSSQKHTHHLFFMLLIALIGHLDFWYMVPPDNRMLKIIVVFMTLLALYYLWTLPTAQDNSDIPYKILYVWYLIYVGSTILLVNILTHQVLRLNFWISILLFVVLETILLLPAIESKNKR
ncbi:hypothetical protein [Leuconostoc fallax]|uniref:Uncharacterized protein n=1 Tax=Leuconostoc fallax TaxID=1251 RepID=A0A4R5N7M4_9LACO|nr:hypothetical protein [Leuconostoc fallax]MBU7455184.1 hypothetical protein [Leuconostoc fallax]TDG67713.1 hypothetical protein C5L23_001512 [Leuconostoc fallax]